MEIVNTIPRRKRAVEVSLGTRSLRSQRLGLLCIAQVKGVGGECQFGRRAGDW